MASIDDTIARLDALKGRISEASDTIAQRGAEVALEEKQAALEAGTYARPIPTTKRGKPAWSRSGALKNDQAIVRVVSGKREVRNTGASAAYEPRVANLPTGKDGVNRSNDAAPTAQRAMEKRLPEIVADELAKAARG